MFKSITQGISNLWTYRKIIWADRDWDWGFLITLLHYKLERMEKYHRLSKVVEDHIKMADEIKIAKDAAHRIMSDDYLENALKPHYEYWGESYEELLTEPLTSNTYALKWVKSRPLMTNEDYELAKADKMEKYELSDKMLEDDINLLFTHINKNMRKWWD